MSMIIVSFETGVLDEHSSLTFLEFEVVHKTAKCAFSISPSPLRRK